MNVFIVMAFFLPCLALTLARGPHHPRGQKVVKKHVHYRPTKEVGGKITEDVELLHDKEHLQEHLGEIISEPDLSKMSDEEIEFYYFQVHDSDKNEKLDGLEILQAIMHTEQHDDDDDDDHDHDTEETIKPSVDENANEFEYYVELIDRVLKEDDVDEDGYLSYPEYVAGRRQSRNINELSKGPIVKMIT